MPPFSSPHNSFVSTASLLRDPPQTASTVNSWPSNSSDTPYPTASQSKTDLLASKFSLSPDPSEWGSNVTQDFLEPDDALHDPEIRFGKELRGHPLSMRGVANLGCMIILCVGLICLFAVYPVTEYFTKQRLSTLGGFNLGGINASGQVPTFIGNWGLIDLDTPKSAYTKPSWTQDNVEMQLVFSDEFNTDGRTFYPGDDPYWEAVDLHYWETNNLEWYDPSAVTTANGSLIITLTQVENHELNFQGGLLSTWNKFCFTGGYIETSAQLPGLNNVVGLWPAVWTMGNLGRAGYGASLEGMWPYTYDSCDVGTVANQTINGQPVAATINGDTGKGGVLSYLPGQRLSRCTCEGESHPGPKHSDGTYVGRAAPEIDIFEAQITGTPLMGQVSQSAQWAPFNAGYIWANTSQNLIIPDPSLSVLNTFIGSATQEATSVVTTTDQDCYEYSQGCFAVYGFEYVPGFDNAYITWISSGQVAWTLNAAGMGADTATEISARPVPQEPMYIIANLGLSLNFGPIDFNHLIFPTHLKIDYIRVYQPKNSINIGCDPPDFPTAAYINEYIEAYTNPNLTTWDGDYGQAIPKNSFLGQC